LLPTSEKLNQAIAIAVKEVTGQSLQPFGPVTSDGGSFLQAGIPATTIATTDKDFGVTGFHRPADHLDRVVFERLYQGVDLLLAFLRQEIS
jgi:hypothetical protein